MMNEHTTPQEQELLEHPHAGIASTQNTTEEEVIYPAMTVSGFIQTQLLNLAFSLFPTAFFLYLHSLATCLIMNGFIICTSGTGGIGYKKRGRVCMNASI